ncbi:hypothetical protein L596_018143 [Steinernema carpocapsae]|uniref:C3H1-type domain-containing protein n=1 Tax=Steinernema carpocapsae TaxID=34508 RepID=A0A4U5N4I0_STECR|nr:hypothetical protein L596_018143 [Steinernema carpocapsae]
MQSIIDKQHASHGHTFMYPLSELDDIVDHHPGDAGILHDMRVHFTVLEGLDCNVHDPSWKNLQHAFSSLADLIDRHVIFTRNRNAERANGSAFNGGRRERDVLGRNAPQGRRYKTQACKIVMAGKQCPRGDRCNFAHDVQELRPQKLQEVGRRPSQNSASQPSRNFSSASASSPTAPVPSYSPPNNRPSADPMQSPITQPVNHHDHQQPIPTLPPPSALTQQLPTPQTAPTVVPVLPVLIPGTQRPPEMIPAPVIQPVPMMNEQRDCVNAPPPQPFFMLAQPAPPPVAAPVATVWPNPNPVPIPQMMPVMPPVQPPPNAAAAWLHNNNTYIAPNPAAQPCPPPMGVMHPSNGSAPFRFEGSDGVTYFEDSFCTQTFSPGPMVGPGFMPRYPLMPPAPFNFERSEAQQSNSSSSNKSHWELTEGEQLKIRRDEIITRLHNSGISNISAALGYDDGGDDDDSREHVSYTVANAVLFDEKDGHGTVTKNLQLPPIPMRYNSFLSASTAEQIRQMPCTFNTVLAPSNSLVRTVCPTTFVRGNSAPPATVQADCSRMKVKDIIDQPLPTPVIQYTQMVQIPNEVVDPGHLAERLPSVIRPLPPTPRDPQNVVSSTLDRIVDVRERIHDVHMNGGLTSAVEKQQLDVELNIVSRGIQSLDRQTKQVCLLKELKAVDEKIEHLNVNA